MARFLIAWLALITAPLVHSAEDRGTPPAMLPNAQQAGDPQAPVPATTYRSAFRGYRTPAEDVVISWRDANDLVGRIGGWRVYAREAQEPASRDQTPTAPTPDKRKE
jgi:hypothetical protein